MWSDIEGVDPPDRRPVMAGRTTDHRSPRAVGVADGGLAEAAQALCQPRLAAGQGCAVGAVRGRPRKRLPGGLLSTDPTGDRS